ncbi:MAG: hypothetical protein ABF289_01070 [Clostridiales bacterium]
MNLAIILKGTKGTGKTTTIKIVYDLIKSTYKNISITKIDRYIIDIAYIITIDKLKIGILSQGDIDDTRARKRVHRTLKKFFENNCDVILCVSRTDRSKHTQDLLNILTINNFEICSFDKVSDYDDEKKAKEIFDKLTEYISRFKGKF